MLGLTAIAARPTSPRARSRRSQPQPTPGGITGVVWRDFKPGGGKPGAVDQGELGLPSVTVELRDAPARSVERRRRPRRHLRVHGPRPGHLPARRSAPATFAKPVQRRLLARAEADHAGDHDRLHLDLGRLRDGRDRGRPRGDPTRRARGGAHRRRHGVAGLPPGYRAAARARAQRRLHHDADQRAQGLRHRDRDRAGVDAGDANVLALAMWRTAFGGANDFGARLGDRRLPLPARGPVLLLNIRRFRREV